MGYSGFTTSERLPLAPSELPRPVDRTLIPESMPFCPEHVITLPTKPLYPSPGPTDKLETIEEYKERLHKRLPKIEVLETVEELQQRLWSTPVPQVQPELDYIPGRDTFGSYHRKQRLGENVAVLVLSVSDEEGHPVPSAVTVAYPNVTESYEAIGDAISIPLDPLKLGVTTITVLPPEGWETPNSVKLTLNPGTQEVKIVLQKSRDDMYIAAAGVGALALIGLGFVIL